MRRFVSITVAVAIVVLGASPAHATFPGRNGKIAAESSGTIYLIDPVTAGRAALVPGEYPAWSPDGLRIAYHTAPTSDVRVVGTDGTGGTRLTFHEREDANPAWSPDNRRIAFVSNRLGPLDLYVMNADGTAVTRLTRNFENGGNAYKPSWSPDGDRIAYIGEDRNGFPRVHVIDVDGAQDTALAAGSEFGPRDPDWSPDGARILYQGSDGSGVRHLYAVTPDGSEVDVLPNTAGSPSAVVYEPGFSPDGRRVVFGLSSCPLPGELCRSMIASQRLDGSDRRIEAGGPNGEFWSAPDWGRANLRPVCDDVIPEPDTLWPPNRQFRTVTLAGAADPDGDAVTLRVTAVSHDEGDAGDSRPGVSADQVLLRAARDPHGDGRVYTIGFEAGDELGATCTGEATVTVPRHKP